MAYEQESVQSTKDQMLLSADGQRSSGSEELGSKEFEENGKSESSNDEWNWKNELLYLSMFACNIFAYSSYSLMAPLFPGVATEKGISFTVQGMIFASYACGQIISAPLVKMLMPYMEVKHTFMTGILFVSVWITLFGFLPWLQDRNVFIACCFICRLGMAFGVVAAKQAMFLTVTLTWPEDIAFRLGTMETGITIGLMLGPVFAGKKIHSGCS